MGDGEAMNGVTARLAEAIGRELNMGRAAERSEERAERLARLEAWQEFHGQEHRWLETEIKGLHARVVSVETAASRPSPPAAAPGPAPSIWRSIPWPSLAWPGAASVLLVTGHLTAAEWISIISSWIKKLG